MNVQKDASCSHGVTMLHRSVLRKHNMYSMCMANPTEGCRKMSVPMDTSNHKLIRRSDVWVSWLWPLCDVRRYVSHKLCIVRETAENKQSRKTGLLKIKPPFLEYSSGTHVASLHTKIIRERLSFQHIYLKISWNKFKKANTNNANLMSFNINIDLSSDSWHALTTHL